MPATHLLDTSVFSQRIKRKPVKAALDRWDALGDARTVISVICEAEVRFGLHKQGSPSLREAFENLLMNRLPILPVDSSVAEPYARLRAECERSGNSVADMDLLIAATAKTHNLIVATLNLRDFEKIPGLTVEDWSQT